MKTKALTVLMALILMSGSMLNASGPNGHADDSLSRRSRRREFIKMVESGYGTGQYSQDSLMYDDPEGDARLIRQLDTIPIKILYYLANGNLPQYELQRQQEPSFKIGRTLPFDNDSLLNDCARIMRGNFPAIFPVIGHEHEWSPEARAYMNYGFWHRLGRHVSGLQQDFPCPLFLRSKLFLCLACGWTSRYCATGQEKYLLERLMDYPDGGVRLHDAFAESYVLNNGNIYLTFLTCENVLADRPHRKGREYDPLQKKLAYIRHDSEELGDNYGAWYHFFGIALYALVRTGAESLLVADTESLGSLFMEGPDRQEYLINHYGAIFGRRFREMLEDGSWWLKAPSAES